MSASPPRPVGSDAARARRRPRDAGAPVTLSDIAAELGVSLASVSNALRHPERVSASLREAVVEMANRTGYSGPRAAGRILPRGRPDALGVVLTSLVSRALVDPAAAQFLSGVGASTEAADLGLLLVPAGTQPSATTSHVANAMVDGFIVYSLRRDDPLLDAVLSRGLPVAVVDSPLGVTGTDWVWCNDFAAAAELGTHLAGLGHQTVGVLAPQLNVTRVSGPARPERWQETTYEVMRQRLSGLCAGLQIAPAELAVEERPDNSIPTGVEAAHSLLERRSGITAICAMTDLLALGALTALRQRGVSVPEDVSVTGFDDIPESARAGLTTVHQPHHAKGQAAVELLLSAAGRSGRSRSLPTNLVVRTSSGQARSLAGP